MKKLFILFYTLLLGVHSFAFDPGVIDKKVKQVFDSTFPHATDVNWQEWGESYEVYFLQDGIRYRIFYAKDKSYTRIIRYYKEESLPHHVRLLLSNDFPDKKIYGITEVSEVGQAANHLTVSYYVRVEDAKKWFIVKVDLSGNSAIVEKFKKN